MYQHVNNMYQRAHAHLQRAHELLQNSFGELYAGFGVNNDVIIKTTLGEKITGEVMRTVMVKTSQNIDVQVVDAKIKEIENASDARRLFDLMNDGEVRGAYVPLEHGMLIKFPLMPKSTTIVPVKYKGSEIRKAKRDYTNLLTKADVLLRLSLQVKGTGEAFDVPPLNQLSSMQFRLHQYNTDEVLEEADLNKTNLVWPSAARYYTIRRAWVFCQVEAQELRFPSRLDFQAFWEGTPFFAFHARREVIDGDLVYLLTPNWDSDTDSITRCARPGAGPRAHTRRALALMCHTHACVWKGESEQKKYREATIDSLGRPSTKPIRPFRTDGCSHDAINQFGPTCWFVTVPMLLTKIEPLYTLVSNNADVKEWIDRDRSSGKTSPASCQLDILPEGIHRQYREFNSAEISPNVFNFTGKYGGDCYSLLRATLLYCKIIPDHCTWTELNWPLPDANSYLPPSDIHINAPELHEVEKWPGHHATPTKMCIMHIHEVKLHKRDFSKLVGSKPTLLGGVIHLQNSAEVPRNTHSRHVVPFTMCDGAAVICNWGECSNHDHWNSLNLNEKNIMQLLLIFGAEGTSQPKPIPPSPTLILVLSNPLQSLHVHLQIDGRNYSRHYDSILDGTSPFDSFKAVVVKIAYEHSTTMEHPSNVPLEGETVTVYFSQNLNKITQYQIVDHPVEFATHINATGSREQCNWYIGDISYMTLRNWLRLYS